MSVFLAKVDADGWIVSDHSKNPPILRFRGTQEECECVAGALNELVKEQHAKLIAAENERRRDKLAQWDRERGERIQALEKTLRGLTDSVG
jgi:late competence protein required for DNA uptake (superfamily II DNA/RNA helicase)